MMDTRNHYAFHWRELAECTDEQMYWLGWLASDGFIYHHKYIVGLDIKKNDEKIVERFKEFIGAKTFGYGKKNNCYTRMSSLIMYNRLIQLGITECKSKTIVVHNQLADDVMFWRGVFEGDGSIFKSDGNWNFAIYSGSYQFLQQWCEFINLSEDYIYPNKKLWRFQIAKQSEIVKILHTLYSQPGIELRLERKWILVDECLSELDHSYLMQWLNSPK